MLFEFFFVLTESFVDLNTFPKRANFKTEIFVDLNYFLKQKTFQN